MNNPYLGGSASDWLVSFTPSVASASGTAYFGSPISYQSPGPRPTDGLHSHSFPTTPCPRYEFCTLPRESPGETVATVTIMPIVSVFIVLAAGRTLSRVVRAWATDTAP